jgi:hypothetical protein
MAASGEASCRALAKIEYTRHWAAVLGWLEPLEPPLSSNSWPAPVLAARARIFDPSRSNCCNSSAIAALTWLHIVNEIVKSHGGLIEIDDVGGCVTFRVMLPVVTDAPVPPGQGGDSSGR